MNHWDLQAKKQGANMKASWGDSLAIQLEIDAIGKYINDNDSVLDVGCANGYSLNLQKGKVRIGVDISEEMIALAKKKVFDCDFFVNDARNLDFPNNAFDVVYTTRCLINLPSWEEQRKAILECMRVAKRVVIFSEAFYEPWIKLNALREIAGLYPLIENDFNRYLKKKKIEELLGTFENIDFSSVYYLGSRFIRELVNIKDESYENEINKQFWKWQRNYSLPGFGLHQLYVHYKP